MATTIITVITDPKIGIDIVLQILLTKNMFSISNKNEATIMNMGLYESEACIKDNTITPTNKRVKATAFYKDEIVYISSKSGERNKRISHYLTSEYDLACIFERLETIGTL